MPNLPRCVADNLAKGCGLSGLTDIVSGQGQTIFSAILIDVIFIYFFKFYLYFLFYCVFVETVFVSHCYFY